jgi:hypothetical protein
MLRLSKLLLALAISLPLLPAIASATPITYGYVAGHATINLATGNTVLSSDTATITGTFVTFDDAIPALTDFEFVIDDGAVNLGPLGSVDVLLTATAPPGFSGPATPIGVDNWSWTGSAYDIVGSLGFTGGPFNGQTIPVNLTLPSLSGFFRTGTVNGNDFSLTNAVDIYQFTAGGVPYKVQVMVQFNAVPVPEPATAALLAGGLVALVARRPASGARSEA